MPIDHAQLLQETIVKEHNNFPDRRKITLDDVKIIKVTKENLQDSVKAYLDSKFEFVIPMTEDDEILKLFMAEVMDELKE